MPSTFDFPSISNLGLCYRFHTSSMDLWDSGYNTAGLLSYHFGRFDTYGDGTCQHSHEIATSYQDFEDCLISLAEFMLEHREAAETIHYSAVWNTPPSDNQIRFALSLKHDPAKVRYYCYTDCKVSSSASKRYDRRWEEIPSWADGSVVSAFSILARKDAEALYRFALYHRIRQYVSEHVADVWNGETPAIYLKFTDDQEKARRCNLAFETADIIIKSYRDLGYAKHWLDSYRRNNLTEPATETETVNA